MKKVIFILLFIMTIPLYSLAQIEKLDIPLDEYNNNICVPSTIGQNAFQYRAEGSQISNSSAATWTVENGRFVVGSTTHTTVTTTGGHWVTIRWDEPPFTLNNQIQKGKMAVGYILQRGIVC